MLIIFNVFIEFVTMLFVFYVSGFWPQGMWDTTWDTSDNSRIGRWSFNHWTTREVPELSF